MKVSELEGADLDYWVARAEGLPEAHIDKAVGRCFYKREPDADEIRGYRFADYMPSQIWDEGGPIIDREDIAVWRSEEGWRARHPDHATGGYYDSEMGIIDADWSDGLGGKTPLEAAMRAFVASKFGDEVTSASSSDQPGQQSEPTLPHR